MDGFIAINVPWELLQLVQRQKIQPIVEVLLFFLILEKRC